MANDYSRQQAEEAQRRAAEQGRRILNLDRQNAAVRNAAEAAYRQEAARQAERAKQQGKRS